MNGIFSLLACVGLMAILGACANIQGISGGPEDNEPPQWVTEGSTPAYQLNFNARTITLHFSEWIKLDNPSTQIFISPTTLYPLKSKLKGKSLIVELDNRDSLRPNTTYTLQFGKSIKDITKGNVLENLKYVFSTGDFLDSLKIQGRVIDAFTQNPKKQTVVSLYKNLEDSAFKKTKPDYYTITDESGNFKMDYLSPGCYKLYALEDKNQNYYYDQQSEDIGFLQNCVDLITFSSGNELILQTASQRFPLQTRETNKQPGFTYLRLNRSAKESIRWIEQDTGMFYLESADSAVVWNPYPVEKIAVWKAEDKLDTVIVKPAVDLHRDSSFRMKVVRSSFPANDALILQAAFPIRSLDSSGFYLIDSSARLNAIRRDSSDPRRLRLTGNWRPGTQQTLICQKGALQNCFHQNNALDSLRFQLPLENSYASLIIQVDSFSFNQILLQLILNDALMVERKATISPTERTFRFTHLVPGNYKLRIVSDLNQNQHWDTSDFDSKQPAEPVYYYTLPELRADWEVKANIKY